MQRGELKFNIYLVDSLVNPFCTVILYTYFSCSVYFTLCVPLYFILYSVPFLYYYTIHFLYCYILYLILSALLYFVLYYCYPLYWQLNLFCTAILLHFSLTLCVAILSFPDFPLRQTYTVKVKREREATLHPRHSLHSSAVVVFASHIPLRAGRGVLSFFWEPFPPEVLKTNGV